MFKQTSLSIIQVKCTPAANTPVDSTSPRLACMALAQSRRVGAGAADHSTGTTTTLTSLSCSSLFFKVQFSSFRSSVPHIHTIKIRKKSTVNQYIFLRLHSQRLWEDEFKINSYQRLVKMLKYRNFFAGWNRIFLTASVYIIEIIWFTSPFFKC